MSKLVLVLLSIAILGSGWFLRNSMVAATTTAVTPQQTGSYLQMGALMSPLDESHPAANTFDYSWNTGRVRFQIVPGSTLVIGSESYVQPLAAMGAVTESHPTGDTVCYQWSTGLACFQSASGTGTPSLRPPQ